VGKKDYYSTLPSDQWEIRPHARYRLVGVAGGALIAALGRTWKVRAMDWGPVADIMLSRRFIIAFWHSRLLIFAHTFKNWGGLCMVSRSTDGELIAQVIKARGHHPVRGSSTRGGSDAMDVMTRRLMQKDQPAAFATDGPQGPRYKVQPGVIALARRTGYPIIPATYSARRRWVTKSWDRFIVPKPFSDCLLVFGNVLEVPPDLDRPQMEEKRRALERELNRITLTADRHFGLQTP